MPAYPIFEARIIGHGHCLVRACTAPEVAETLHEGAGGFGIGRREGVIPITPLKLDIDKETS